jgi:hypothetical protein
MSRCAVSLFRPRFRVSYHGRMQWAARRMIVQRLESTMLTMFYGSANVYAFDGGSTAPVPYISDGTRTRDIREVVQYVTNGTSTWGRSDAMYEYLMNGWRPAWVVPGGLVGSWESYFRTTRFTSTVRRHSKHAVCSSMVYSVVARTRAVLRAHNCGECTRCAPWRLSAVRFRNPDWRPAFKRNGKQARVRGLGDVHKRRRPRGRIQLPFLMATARLSYWDQGACTICNR